MPSAWAVKFIYYGVTKGSDCMKALDKNRLIADIKNVGVEIVTIDDLMTLDLSYRDLIPIMLKHLSEIEDEQDKAFIVRCLGVKGLIEVSDILLQEFESALSDNYKWAIGNSLCLISDKSILDKMLDIVKNKKHGMGRQMIVYGLGNFPTDEVKATLLGLLPDDEILGHTIFALGKMKDRSIIPHIEVFEKHERSYIRNETKKAIKKLSKN
jgi:HEAT repeat protein